MQQTVRNVLAKLGSHGVILATFYRRLTLRERNVYEVGEVHSRNVRLHARTPNCQQRNCEIALQEERDRDVMQQDETLITRWWAERYCTKTRGPI